MRGHGRGISLPFMGRDGGTGETAVKAASPFPFDSASFVCYHSFK